MSRQGRAGQGRAGQGRAGQGRAGQGRAGQGRAGQGRAGQARAGQGRAKAGLLQVVGDLETVDGVWVADVVLHQTGFLWGDTTGVRHQLDTPPPR